MRGLLLSIALLELPACVSVPASPYTLNQYVRTRGSLLSQSYEADPISTDGPHPGIGIMYGVHVGAYEERAHALEVGASMTGISGDLEGTHVSYALGYREFFRLGRRFRPTWTAGMTYNTVRFRDLNDDFDILGPGVYAGAGVDYALSARWSIGLEGLLHLMYSNTKGAQEFVTGFQGGLSLMFRF